MSLYAELGSFCIRDFSKEEEDKNSKLEEGDEDEDAKVKRVVVYSGEIIDSLTFHYELGGKLSGKFDLNFPVEYLTGITGTYRPRQRWYHYQYDKPKPGISSLKFVTNLKEYGPFGKVEGCSFKLPVEDGMILGSHGRMDTFLRTSSMEQSGKNHLSRELAVRVHVLETHVSSGTSYFFTLSEINAKTKNDESTVHPRWTLKYPTYKYD